MVMHIVTANSSSQEDDRENTLAHLSAMLLQESSSGYALPSSNADWYDDSNNDVGTHQEEQNDRTIKAAWRRKICEWSFEVVDHFGFDREIVSISLSFLDRYVVSSSTSSSTFPNMSRQLEFQLLAMTCLYIAMKLFGEVQLVTPTLRDQERRPPKRQKLKVDAFVQLSRDLFSISDIEAMERRILQVLTWRLHPPTPVKFVACMLRLVVPQEETMFLSLHQSGEDSPIACIYEMARYLTELAVCIPDLCLGFKPSLVAYASTVCAMELLPEAASVDYNQDAMMDLATHYLGATMPSMKQQVQHARWMLMKLYYSMMDDEISPPVSVESSSSLSASSSSGNNDENTSSSVLNVNNANTTTTTKPACEHRRKKSPVCIWDNVSSQ